MLNELREWTSWLFELTLVVLVAKSVFLEKETLKWIVKEYEYDEFKDLEKKQRKTRTTKRTTQNKDGGTTVEESTEVSEPVEEKK